jgi:tetratricopeptide (TPR) repeat protein
MSDSSRRPEYFVQVAVDALDRGDLPAAARAVGRVLVVDPHRREWLALLSKIVESAEDPLELIPLRPEGMPIGSMAVRAYACFKVEEYQKALDLILKAAIAAPQSPFLDWALSWLKRPDTSNALNCLKLTDRFRTVLDELPRLRERDDRADGLLSRIPPLIQRIRETQICDIEFLLTAVELLRSIPDLAGAYQAARDAHDIEPNRATCLALASVYRDQGDSDRAGTWYQAALEHKPDDLSIRNELGDMLWEAGRLEESEHWYRAAVQIDPEEPWANPSMLGVRYERTGDEQVKEELETYLESFPNNARARALVDRFSPYFSTWLPEPAEASLGLVRMMAEKWHQGQEFNFARISLSWLEAPSVYLAYNLEMEHEGRRGRLTIDVESVPRPDVRLPRVPVKYQVWRYTDTKPYPALTAPPKRITDTVASIALGSYHLKTWLAQAAEIGQQLGPGRAMDLLAAMVHPPRLPEGVWPWTWVQHNQIAAALIIGKFESAWKGSVRRQVLFDLANGPLDWTTNAAILALAALADDEPDIVDEVAGLFNEILRDAPQGGYICHLHTLVCCYQRLPNLSTRERHELKQWRRQLETGAS